MLNTINLNEKIRNSNNTNDTVPNAQKLPTLLHCCDCLAEGSKILMADGCERKIENIAVGNKILIDYTYQTATVTNTWEGIEREPIIQFEMEDGTILNCTSQHPIATTEGMIVAGKIKNTHILFGKNGAHSAIKTIGTYPPCAAFNLSIEPNSDYKGMFPTLGTTMICNGLIVGDFEMQIGLEFV